MTDVAPERPAPGRFAIRAEGLTRLQSLLHSDSNFLKKSFIDTPNAPLEIDFKRLQFPAGSPIKEIRPYIIMEPHPTKPENQALLRASFYGGPADETKKGFLFPFGRKKDTQTLFDIDRIERECTARGYKTFRRGGGVLSVVPEGFSEDEAFTFLNDGITFKNLPTDERLDRVYRAFAELIGLTAHSVFTSATAVLPDRTFVLEPMLPKETNAA